MGQSFSEVFEAVCRDDGNRIATVDPAGIPVSFSNFFYTVLAFAEALQGHGVAKRDLVAVHVDDAIVRSMLTLALLRLGATAMGAVGADGSLGFSPDWHLVEAGKPGTGGADIVVGPEWIRSPTRFVPIAGGGRLIRNTSGTTGLPKTRVVADEDILFRVRRSTRLRGQPEGAVFIGYAPSSTPFFNHMARSLLAGVAHIHPRDDDATSLQLMDAVGVTTAYLSPWNYRRMLAAIEAGAVRPRALRRIITGGGEVAPAAAIRGEELFGAEVYLSYGSNETGSIAHARPAERPDLPGYLGKPYSDLDLRFQNPDGSPADPAEGGELWLMSPPEIRVLEFPSGKPVAGSDGWVCTGDICRLLPDGSLQFLGRSSELLNIGGNKAAPQRFEALARAVPGVSEVVAFRLPEPGGGDRLGLAVVPGLGFDAGTLSDHMSAQLGETFPFEIVIRDSLPVSAAGKTDRRRLTADHGDPSSQVAPPP
ncbi:class I adenylate-forming enzyme family protein [Frigidibacter sp. ROC022]|uniref:class I adenylate-forming enzyme family protein n=1 Tax=Frigidibacter sp. ROC022 TaxID=2971796 RepID=UPI00215A606A|nr:fatty acid--CoA ligase family protein [Frigidibacter sp. ROC022]MCR8725545.1 fatty acid--CoA ligase family protein [Frigidibacter sp. ROC022]